MEAILEAFEAWYRLLILIGWDILELSYQIPEFAGTSYIGKSFNGETNISVVLSGFIVIRYKMKHASKILLARDRLFIKSY